ncbi:unnamed protein product [Cercopithifilaria johnstoni]|uniref:Uncharacterized protein n=1 Tax=Cercopithifilaria johnstoni TaxID=2874296 RepID=A0A8J2MAM5_9BILA|nr:unnamed protein product [Cercopithifilaria johnstoni]
MSPYFGHWSSVIFVIEASVLIFDFQLQHFVYYSKIVFDVHHLRSEDDLYDGSDRAEAGAAGTGTVSIVAVCSGLVAVPLTYAYLSEPFIIVPPGDNCKSQL